MAKKIHFRLTGEAEKFIEYMEEQGLTARDVMARALWLFEKAWKTRRVAILDDKFQIEYIYTAKPLAGEKELVVAGTAHDTREHMSLGAALEKINKQTKEALAVEEHMKKQGGSEQGDLKTEREGQ